MNLPTPVFWPDSAVTFLLIGGNDNFRLVWHRCRRKTTLTCRTEMTCLVCRTEMTCLVAARCGPSWQGKPHDGGICRGDEARLTFVSLVAQPLEKLRRSYVPAGNQTTAILSVNDSWQRHSSIWSSAGLAGRRTFSGDDAHAPAIPVPLSDKRQLAALRKRKSAKGFVEFCV